MSAVFGCKKSLQSHIWLLFAFFVILRSFLMQLKFVHYIIPIIVGSQKRGTGATEDSISFKGDNYRTKDNLVIEIHFILKIQEFLECFFSHRPKLWRNML